MECKGGTSLLKCRKDFQQGSTEYLLDIITNMSEKTRNLSSKEPIKATTILLLEITYKYYTGNIVLEYYEAL
jgi:hypothetical protein